MVEKNSATLVKIFEYLSDRQFDSADVQQQLIKMKHHTDADALSQHCEAKKNNWNHTCIPVLQKGEEGERNSRNKDWKLVVTHIPAARR